MTTVLNLEPITTLTREQFEQLCISNPELQLERNPQLFLVYRQEAIALLM